MRQQSTVIASILGSRATGPLADVGVQNERYPEDSFPFFDLGRRKTKVVGLVQPNRL